MSLDFTKFEKVIKNIKVELNNEGIDEEIVEKSDCDLGALTSIVRL